MGFLDKGIVNFKSLFDVKKIDFDKVDLAAGAFSVASSALSAYGAAKAKQAELKMQENNYHFQAEMGKINAEMIEAQAQYISRAGEQKSSSVSMQYGQKRAEERSKQAAQNVDSTVGSAAENLVSLDVAKEIDMLTINANTVMQVAAQHTQKTNALNESLLASTSAELAKNSREGISPFSDAISHATAAGISYGGSWARDKYKEQRYQRYFEERRKRR